VTYRNIKQLKFANWAYMGELKMVNIHFDAGNHNNVSCHGRRLLAVAVAGALEASLGACGSSESADSAQGTVINVAVAANSKPLSYTATDGSLSGYEVDILNAVDKQLADYRFNIEAVADDAEEIGLDSGKYGLITGGYFKTESREKKYLFPEVNTGVSLMRVYTLKKNTSITSLDDLHGKKVAPVSPSGGVNNLLTSYNSGHADRQIDIVRQENVSLAENFKGLLSGKYDAVVEPEQSFDYASIKASLGNKFRFTEPVQVDNQYFVVSKKQSAFLKKLNKALNKLKKDGTLKKLSKQYFNEDVFRYEGSARQ